MSGFAWAWLIIMICAVAGAGIVYKLLGRVLQPFVRTFLVVLLVTFFLVPAPVPGYESQFAPAFVVLIFEAFFQIDGNPGVSLRILLICMALAIGLTVLAQFLSRRLRPSSQSED